MATLAANARDDGEVRNLSSLLDVLQRRIDRDGATADITVGDVLKLIGRRAYGPFLLLIGLISISPAALIPGSTWAFATLTLLLAAQLALHKERPWMPNSALDVKLSEKKLQGFIKAARPTARFVDRIVRPRLTFLADPPWVILVALLCAAAALITFPLGLIPLAPFAPGLAIAFFGLGLTARDGLMLSLGGCFFGVALWLVATRAGALF